MPKMSRAWLIVISSLCFAMVIAYISMNHGERYFNRTDTINQQFAVLRGEPQPFGDVDVYIPEFQNRILFPALYATITKITVFDLSEWYLITRIGNIFILGLVFWFVMQRAAHAPVNITLMGLGLAAYALVFTFNQGWEYTSDFNDFAFMLLFIFLALRKKYWILLPVALLASANRESSAFAGVIWFSLYAFDAERKPVIKEWIRSAILSVSAYAVVVGLRVWLGGDQLYQQQTITAISALLGNLRVFFQHPTIFAWVVLMVVMLTPIVLWLWANRAYIRGELLRLFIAGMLITLITIIFGALEELRVFIPILAVLIYVCVAAETARQQNEAIES